MSLRLDRVQHSSTAIYWLKTRYMKGRLRALAAVGLSGDFDRALAEIRTRKRNVYTSLRDRIAGFRLLDIGGGIGGDRTQEKYGARCYRVEPSATLIAAAQARDPGRGHVRAIAGRLPFPDRTFDVVQAEYVFHHIDLDEQDASLAEMFRVSRDTVMILDSCSPSPALPRSLMRAFWKITDGGAIYRTREEWLAFVGRPGVETDAFFGSGWCRSCLFVMRKAGS